MDGQQGFYRLLLRYDFESFNRFNASPREYEAWKSRLTFETKRIVQQQLPCVQLTSSVAVVMHWYLKNKRKDPNNIYMNEKAITDGMVNAKLLKDDSFRYTSGGLLHLPHVDARYPRLEVFIYPNQNLIHAWRAMHRVITKSEIKV